MEVALVALKFLQPTEHSVQQLHFQGTTLCGHCLKNNHLLLLTFTSYQCKLLSEAALLCTFPPVSASWGNATAKGLLLEGLGAAVGLMPCTVQPQPHCN